MGGGCAESEAVQNNSDGATTRNNFMWSFRNRLQDAKRWPALRRAASPPAPGLRKKQPAFELPVILFAGRGDSVTRFRQENLLAASVTNLPPAAKV